MQLIFVVKNIGFKKSWVHGLQKINIMNAFRGSWRFQANPGDFFDVGLDSFLDDTVLSGKQSFFYLQPMAPSQSALGHS